MPGKLKPKNKAQSKSALKPSKIKLKFSNKIDLNQLVSDNTTVSINKTFGKKHAADGSSTNTPVKNQVTKATKQADPKNPTIEKESFLVKLRKLFFPAPQDLTPQKQTKELQFGIYCLATLNLVFAIVNPYILIDALILFLIGFNINKTRKKYVSIMLVFYTLTSFFVNNGASNNNQPLNFVNILLLVFSIQAIRLNFFGRKS